MKIPTQYATDGLIDVALVCEDGRVLIETHKAMLTTITTLLCSRGKRWSDEAGEGGRGNALLYR